MCGLTKAVLSTQHSLGEVNCPVLDRPPTPRPRQVAFAEMSQLGMIPLSQLLDQSPSPAAITSLCSFGTYHWSVDDGRGTRTQAQAQLQLQLGRKQDGWRHAQPGSTRHAAFRFEVVTFCPALWDPVEGGISHTVHFSRPEQHTGADIESTSDRLARVDTCAVLELFVPLYPPASLPRGQSLAL